MENETESHGELSDPLRHLYVHFPFCARICPYCAFYKTRGNANDVEQFCQALAVEAEFVAREFPLKLETIFFGGGTPTALSTKQLKQILQRFHVIFDLSGLQEFTIEANPGSVSANKARALRDNGISRLSLGVQSWDDKLLRLLGRDHNAAQAEESFQVFRGAGFTNISIDLMFALPGQTQRQWQNTLQKTIDLNPDHISTYCLTYEEDTEFLTRFRRGEFIAEEETEARFFDLTMKVLESAGYHHYEISNYARFGFESRHNRAYWRGADYLGLGPSAFSTCGLRRWQNVADHREYAQRLANGESAIAEIEQLTDKMKRTERIALGLRTSEGIAAEFVNPKISRELTISGLVANRNGNYVLTPSGKRVADSVAEELV